MGEENSTGDLFTSSRNCRRKLAQKDRERKNLSNREMSFFVSEEGPYLSPKFINWFPNIFLALEETLTLSPHFLNL